MQILQEVLKERHADVRRAATGFWDRAPQPAAPGPQPPAPGPQPPAPGPQPPPPNLKNRVAAATPISLVDGMELFIDTSGHVVNGAGVPGELHGGPGE